MLPLGLGKSDPKLKALTEFARGRLIEAGFDAERICVLPNMVDVAAAPVDPAVGEYVAFAGRMSREKGIDTLLQAAARTPDVPLRLAGDGPLLDELADQAPANAKMLGRLSADRMAATYRNARFVVLPSKCYEMCPLVISEAMSHGVPVIASRITSDRSKSILVSMEWPTTCSACASGGTGRLASRPTSTRGSRAPPATSAVR